MLNKIKTAIEMISADKKPIKIISHFDTDGITSAAIFSRALKRAGKKFSLQITKSLDADFISNLEEKYLLIFLDLASGSLNYLKSKNTEIIVFDHHEIAQDIPNNILMINPTLEHEEPLSSAGICYLFAKSISPENKDLANLAVIGMVGDVLGKHISKKYDEIIKDSETIVKKGLLIYPSTRPINKALEYSYSPYIPNVTGSFQNVLALLRDANIQKINGSYKALYELTEEEMSNLITAIMLRSSEKKDIGDLIGNLYLVKFHNKLEDARELSALINACSRMDHPEISLGFCLGNKTFKDMAEKIYMEYRQHIISALRYVSETEKIIGKNYAIINARDKIKDTIIGTIASIVSRSPVYSEGTIIIALAYNEDKIKVSARLSGSNGQNVREILARAVVPIGGEVGGHPNAAGCLISKEKEQTFLAELKKVLDIEVIKV